jgi:hypothetical protein
MRLFILAAVLTAVGVNCAIEAGAQNSSGGVTYRPAPEGTIKYKDGVTVHRHADGSVEVSEPETVQSYDAPQRPVKRVVRRKAAVHKVAVHKATAKPAQKSTKAK